MTPATRQTMTARQRPPNGTLATTSVYAPGTAVGERLAYAYGDLATGTVMYACHDQLGSVRRWRTPSKGNWGANEFEPYGEAYAVSSLAPRDYALHEWDPALAVYRAPYRNYSPTMTRWTTRDPLGMIDGPNMYGYLLGKCISRRDALGLFSETECYENYSACTKDAGAVFFEFMTNLGPLGILSQVLTGAAVAGALITWGACIPCDLGAAVGGMTDIYLVTDTSALVRKDNAICAAQLERCLAHCPKKAKKG